MTGTLLPLKAYAERYCLAPVARHSAELNPPYVQSLLLQRHSAAANQKLRALAYLQWHLHYERHHAVTRQHHEPLIAMLLATQQLS